MTDVVIPLGTGSAWADNELRFCLRSLLRYALDLGRVIVVGHKPKWLSEDAVLHLPADDPRKWHKDARMIRKVLLACDHVSGPFVRMSDDQCLLRPMRLADIPPLGNIMGVPQQPPPGKWALRRHLTQVWLHEHGYGAADFDLHCPMLYDPDQFRRMAEVAPWQDRPGMCINTLYGNVAGLEPVSPQGRIVRFGEAESAKCHRTIFARIRNPETLFLNYRNASLTKPMRYAISVKFPERSPFEVSDHNEKLDPLEWMGKSDAQRELVMTGPPDEVRRARRQRSHARLRSMGPAGRRRLRQKARAA